MKNIRHYNDGYADFDKGGCSIVELVDNVTPGLISNYSVGNAEFDNWLQTEKFTYSFMYPRCALLQEDLNILLTCCKELFLRHEGQRHFCIIRKAKYTNLATKLFLKLQDLQVAAESDKLQISGKAIEETISTTGVPIYTFQNSFISICINFPSLKYMKIDYGQRVRSFLSSVTPVEHRMQRRVLENFFRKRTE